MVVVVVVVVVVVWPVLGSVRVSFEIIWSGAALTRELRGVTGLFDMLEFTVAREWVGSLDPYAESALSSTTSSVFACLENSFHREALCLGPISDGMVIRVLLNQRDKYVEYVYRDPKESQKMSTCLVAQLKRPCCEYIPYSHTATAAKRTE